jgi:hypothetical protein
VAHSRGTTQTTTQDMNPSDATLADEVALGEGSEDVEHPPALVASRLLSGTGLVAA